MEATEWDFREIAEAQQEVIRGQRDEIGRMEAGLDGEKRKVACMRRQLVLALEDGLAWRARAEHLRAEMDTAEGMAGE